MLRIDFTNVLRMTCYMTQTKGKNRYIYYYVFIDHRITDGRGRHISKYFKTQFIDFQTFVVIFILYKNLGHSHTNNKNESTKV